MEAVCASIATVRKLRDVIIIAAFVAALVGAMLHGLGFWVRVG